MATQSGARAAVIGSPVRHSELPAIHNAAFAATGLDWLFVAWEVPEGRATAALSAMQSFNLAGLSVTMPHKTAVAQALDHLSPEAEQLNAVNCVARQPNGQLIGHNTDGAGLLASLRVDAGFDPQGNPAHNGLGMLAHQAGVAFELWTQLEPPIEAMLAAVQPAAGPEP